MTIPLGGTAIGTGLGSAAGFQKLVFKHLRDVSGLPVAPSSNRFDGMQNLDEFQRLSAELETATGAMALLLLAPAVGLRSSRVSDAVFTATHVAPHEAILQLPPFPHACGQFHPCQSSVIVVLIVSTSVCVTTVWFASAMVDIHIVVIVVVNVAVEFINKPNLLLSRGNLSPCVLSR